MSTSSKDLIVRELAKVISATYQPTFEIFHDAREYLEAEEWDISDAFESFQADHPITVQ